MEILSRCLLCLTLLSFGTFAADDKALGEANDYSAFIFGNYKAQSGNNNGAIAIGGDLNIQGYSVASDASIALPEYSLLVEGDARFKNGRLYHGKFRVQGDTSQVSQSVLDGLPAGVVMENAPLDHSIKALQGQYQALSEELVALPANGMVEMKWGGLIFTGDGTESLQVFNVVGDDLKKAHSIAVENIPADATVIVNVVDITAKKLQIVNKSFDQFIPFRAKTLFNFHNAEIVMFNGVSIEASVLAPTAKIEGKNGNVMGNVIAAEWDGQMHFEGIQFSGQWEEDDEQPLSIQITSPDTLSTVGYSPITVTGVATGSVTELTLNGVPVALTGDTFTASVALLEGFNTIIARVTSEAGEQLTDSISISLDLTPPYLTIDSHTDHQTVYSDKITVTGLVNDIVRGTVEGEQASVEVNGVVGSVSNRSYAVKDVSLTEGENLLTITAVDQAGNSTALTRTIFYQVPDARQVILVSGQDQTAIIGEKTAQNLVVRVEDANAEPVADESVVFRVIQGAGVVGADSASYGRAIVATTDSDGIAQTAFQVGYRTGVANHKVRAQVVGYENQVIFYTSAESVIGNKISINSGNNQRGIVDQNLPAPFIVAVTDSGANVVKGARVKFEVISGGGVFQNDLPSYETQTDSDGRALAQFKLGDLTGLDMQRVQATLIDAPVGETLTAGFMASGFVAADPGQTSIVGTVMDNQDRTIPGVTIRIEGTDRTAVTDVEGQFKIEQVPVGPVHIIADGSTALLPGEYPSLSYHLVTVAGVENPLSAPIYMVKLDTDNAVYAGLEDVSLTLPSFPGFQLDIAKDSITFPDGSREGLVSVTSVNASKVPMAPPNGMQPQFIVTIQPVGATFDPPAKLTLPNVDGHAPGAQVEMYSYDHDLEEFVAIGLGTVSEDGSVVASNVGVGVVKAGWHCGSQPGGSGTAHNCPICYKCEGDNCVKDPAQANNPLPADQQTPKDCKTKLCVGDRAEPGDVPDNDVEFDCKKPGCDGKNPTQIPDDNDIKEDDKKCSTCSEGEKIVDATKEGKECGDGTDAKACYTCKDGKCDNHCEAPSDKEVLSLSPPPAFEKVLKEGLDVLNAGLPYFEVKYESTIALEVERGKKCCKDCSKGKDPQDYEKNTITGKAGIGLTFVVPGLGGIFKLPERTYGPIKAGGKITLGPGVRGKLEASASGSSETSKCEEGSDCFEMEAKFDGNAAVGVFFKAEGAVEYCNIFDEEDCDKLVAGTAEANTSVGVGASASFKAYSGDDCTGTNCYSVNVGKVEFVAEVKYDIKAFDIYKYEYKNEVKVALSDGLYNGGSCGG